MVEFRYASLDDLELLVSIRINDLKMFSSQLITKEVISNIRDFYQNNLINNTSETLLGFDNEILVASGTIYQYQIMPSIENKKGIVYQITNVWVDESYRRQRYGRRIIEQLIDNKEGLICLNSSSEGMEMYLKIGFERKDNYLVYRGNK